MPNIIHAATHCRIPRYGKHKASGQAVVYLNGRANYLGKYGTAKSKQEYNRLIQEWRAGGRQLPVKGELTVAELILAYWRAVGEHLHGGREHNLRDALKVVRETYSFVPVAEFGPKALKVVREQMC